MKTYGKARAETTPGVKMVLLLLLVPTVCAVLAVDVCTGSLVFCCFCLPPGMRDNKTLLCLCSCAYSRPVHMRVVPTPLFCMLSLPAHCQLVDCSTQCLLLSLLNNMLSSPCLPFSAAASRWRARRATLVPPCRPLRPTPPPCGWRTTWGRSSMQVGVTLVCRHGTCVLWRWEGGVLQKVGPEVWALLTDAEYLAHCQACQASRVSTAQHVVSCAHGTQTVTLLLLTPFVAAAPAASTTHLPPLTTPCINSVAPAEPRCAPCGAQCR
jgi:hypothetical protein